MLIEKLDFTVRSFSIALQIRCMHLAEWCSAQKRMAILLAHKEEIYTFLFSATDLASIRRNSGRLQR